MAKRLPRNARFAGVMFGAGALTSALGLVTGLSLGPPGLAGALDVIAARLDLYLVVFASSGLTWIVVGAVVRRLAPPVGLVGWGVRVVPVTIFSGPVSLLISLALRGALLRLPMPGSAYLENWHTWFGYLDLPPYNLIALIRAGILVAIASGVGGFGLAGAGERGQGWSPGTMPGSGPGQATRLLCGNALLGGGAFRRRVLGFFEDKWTAVAPEYGLDVRLLANVCAFAEARLASYNLAFAGVGVVGFVLATAAPPVGIPLLVLAGGALWFRKWRGERRLAGSFSRENFSLAGAAAQFGDELDRQIAYALPSERQNVVIYQGFMPFVGAGLDLGGWSFVTFVDKPKVDGGADRIRAFAPEELHAALDAALLALGMPDLECRDVYFVRGIDIRGDREILGDAANRPRQDIGQSVQARYAVQPSERVRGYKRIQVSDWGGELVVTYFLRCTLRGPSLFVEMKRFLLPPVANEYRQVDRMPADRLGLRIGQFLGSLVVGPIYAVFAPFIVFAAIQKAIGEAFASDERRASRRRRTVEDNPMYDFGAATSLRASFAQTSFMHYYQKADADFDSKLIERKILDEIERFLDEHGIDTTDIRDRQTTILNSGILVQGGDVRAESLAVGQGAQANKIESRRTAQPKGTTE